MANYYLDTEFLEGTQDKRFLGFKMGRKTKPTIDLISIGIVSPTTKTLQKPCDTYTEEVRYDREYYAISKDFNLKEAWNRYDEKPHISLHKEDEGKKLTQRIYWIRENVLKPIFKEMEFWYRRDFQWRLREEGEMVYQKKQPFTFKNFKYLLSVYGKTNKQIAREIMQFTLDPNGDILDKWMDSLGGYVNALRKMNCVEDKPEFYAYYADYDWVVFCWLFGKMIDLPKGFPKYCRDLKQMLDEKPLEYKIHTVKYDDKYISGCDPYYQKWKDHKDFPKQDPKKAHNALDDARWNKKLHEFLKIKNYATTKRPHISRKNTGRKRK